MYPAAATIWQIAMHCAGESVTLMSMNNLWLKLWVWFKITLLSLVVIYAILFVWNNTGEPIKVWLFFGSQPETSPLVLSFLSFAAGVVGTLLVRTTLRTLKQLKELRNRRRAQQLQRDVQDIKSKAAMLKTSPSASSASSSQAAGDSQ